MLNPAVKRSLRARAHALKPVILIGQHGVTEAVMAELSRALDAHELIKIRFRGAERELRAAEIERICTTMQADFVSSIGGTAVLYRENPSVPSAPPPPARKPLSRKPAPRRPGMGRTPR
jgi:RNA-binding protein